MWNGSGTPFGENMTAPRSFQEENRRWWNKQPMTYDWHSTLRAAEGSEAFFQEIDRRFIQDHPFAHVPGSPPFSNLIPYKQLRRKRVLEVGCGAGTLTSEFARQGAVTCAVDLSDRAIALTKTRFSRSGLRGHIIHGDGERLPFRDGTMDYVWSWGVLHHTENTGEAVREIYRVLRPGGRIGIMLYHKNSFRYWVHLLLLRGILQGKLLTLSVQDLVTRYTDGAVAKHYTRRQAKKLFPGFRSIRTRLFGLKSELLPIPDSHAKNTLLRLVPNSLAQYALSRMGWFLFIEAEK